MDCIYVGYYVDEELFQALIERGNLGLSHARNNFEGRLLGEIVTMDDEKKWTIFSYIPDKVSDEHLYSNIKGTSIDVVQIRKSKLRDMLGAFLYVWKSLRKGEFKDANVLMYSIHPVLSLPFFCLRRKYGFTITTICSELPQYRAAGNKVGFFENLNFSVQTFLNKLPDRYVLFAEAMKDEIPVREKKYSVVEGICPDTSVWEIQRKNKNIVMYAGGLGKQNNIELLVDACEASTAVDELWICGSGPSAEYVREKSGEKIKYLGIVPPEKILRLEREAKVLVNLRDPSVMVTRYAFPSKILEYMSVGTMVLSTRLDGIPREYYEYIRTVDELTVERVKEQLDRIISMPEEEYLACCEKAKRFVNGRKNANVQARKILDLLNAPAL